MVKPSKSHPVTPRVTSLLVALLTIAVLFVMISSGIAPEQYDISVGRPAPATITASKEVEDVVTKQKMIQEAEARIATPYNNDATVMPVVMADLTAATGQIDKLPELRLGMDGEMIEGATDSMIEQARSFLTEVPLTTDQLRILVEADSGMLSQLSTDVLLTMRDVLNGGLLEGQQQDAVQKIKRDLSGDGYPEPLVAAYCVVIDTYLAPNVLIDTEKLEAEHARVRAEIELNAPKYVIGQNVTQAGQLVTEAQYEVLQTLGLLKDKGIDFPLYVGVALLLLLLGMLIAVYLYTFERDIFRAPRKITLLCVICLVVVGLSLGARALNPYFMPATLGAMLTALLLKSRLAILTNLVLSVMIGLLASVGQGMFASVDGGLFTSTMFCIMITALVSGSACVAIIRANHQRMSVLVAGVASALINALSVMAVSLVNSANTQNLLNWAGWAAGSGILSAVLCIGTQPVLELVFNLETNAKLTDLGSPNQPLLRRLMIEAPGTYHHSMIVANLSEAAANAIGANGLLARVGAYYHDIGKLKRPLYFKENQTHDNPHDRTDPRVSTAILTAHPRDGVEMAQKARLPQAIQEIIRQHHGDTPVLYFYDKAVKQGGEVDIQDFRYDGPRPEKREAAIVMLADTIEAAVRAMTDSSPDKVEQLIQRLVRSKMEDGQLDRCDLTFYDLNRICEAFLHVLSGIHHERIEYPTVDIPERKRLEDAPEPEEKKEVAAELPPERQPEPEGATMPLEHPPVADDAQQKEGEA